MNETSIKLNMEILTSISCYLESFRVTKALGVVSCEPGNNPAQLGMAWAWPC